MKPLSISKSLASAKTGGKCTLMALRLGFAILATVGSAFAQYTYSGIGYLGGVTTTLRGINNHGDTVGGHSVPGGRVLFTDFCQ